MHGAALLLQAASALLATSTGHPHLAPQPEGSSHAGAAVAAVDTRAPISHIAADFLSFNIDAAELRPADAGGTDFPWGSARLAARARHLAPHKLRIGGGAQRGSVYDRAFLTGKLPLITTLARAMNASLVWGVAPCRQEKGERDQGNCSNTAALVGSAAAAGIDEWEYGNEPGMPGSKTHGRSNVSDLGVAFLSFRTLLSSRFPSAPLIGPDVGYGAWAAPPAPGSAGDACLGRFFDVAGPVLDGATVHIYPFDHNDVGGDAHAAAASAQARGSPGGRGSMLGDPACEAEVGPNLPWCNFTRVMWPGPGELFDTAPVQVGASAATPPPSHACKAAVRYALPVGTPNAASVPLAIVGG
jgi:hypothetical protein